MRQTVGLLACVASASAFLSGPAAVPGTTRFNSAINARAGLGLRVQRPAVALRKNAAASLNMQTATGVDTAALAKAANEARGLAMDSIAAAKSGHLGLPLGCAEVSAFHVLPKRLHVLSILYCFVFCQVAFCCDSSACICVLRQSKNVCMSSHSIDFRGPAHPIFTFTFPAIFISIPAKAGFGISVDFHIQYCIRTSTSAVADGRHTFLAT